MLLANNQGTFKLTDGGARVVLPAGALQTILALGQMIFPETSHHLQQNQKLQGTC